MSIFIPKEKISIEQHLGLYLSALYKFDPVPDFIRISRNGLLTEQEFKLLTDEDHYLLTAQEMERLNWLWTKGKIANLSNKLNEEEVHERLGYWLGYNLMLVYGEISGIATAEQKVTKAFEGMQYYLEKMANNNGTKLDVAYKALAPEFVERVLEKTSIKDTDYMEKRFFLNHFAENILRLREKESRKLPIKLVYESPKVTAH